jgi:hypothetical protein
MKNNTYVDKTKNIFLVWKDYVRREKNAIHVIGAITRKYLRMEVFSRIRLVARENFLDQRAEKLLIKYARLWKQKLIGHFFSKWRVNNYKKMV